MPRWVLDWVVVIVLVIFGVDRVIQLVLLIVRDIVEIRNEWRNGTKGR